MVEFCDQLKLNNNEILFPTNSCQIFNLLASIICQTFVKLHHLDKVHVHYCMNQPKYVEWIFNIY